MYFVDIDFRHIQNFVNLRPPNFLCVLMQKNGKNKYGNQIRGRFPRGGQNLKIQYCGLSCSGAGEKETLNINVVGITPPKKTSSY